MTAEARANGWRGFEGIGQRVEGGHLYRCDGMPTLMGCGRELIIPRRLKRLGKKSSGWLVCYGTDFDGTEDLDVVLTFCPECTAVVEAQLTVQPDMQPDGGSYPPGTPTGASQDASP